MFLKICFFICSSCALV